MLADVSEELFVSVFGMEEYGKQTTSIMFRMLLSS
jgi:hypothetical protein